MDKGRRIQNSKSRISNDSGRMSSGNMGQAEACPSNKKPDGGMSFCSSQDNGVNRESAPSESCILNSLFSPKRFSLRHAAFTLLELITVIAIIGFILGVAILGFRGVGEASKVSSAANEIKLILDGARQYARTHSTEVIVAIVSTNATGVAEADILKVLATFYPLKGANGAVTNWAMTGNPYMLPAGVFFDTENRSSIDVGDALNYSAVATNAFLSPSNSLAYAGSGASIDQAIRFLPDGTLDDELSYDFGGGPTSLYDERVFIPIIAAARYEGGVLQGAAAKSNLTAIIEISGQTGMSIIKRVE